MKSKVRQLRTERGWSQGHLAERLGVSRQTVNFIENERYEPSLSLSFKIAQLFRQPIEEIFFPNGQSERG
jgi:putative transcriptional regulator